MKKNEIFLILTFLLISILAPLGNLTFGQEINIQEAQVKKVNDDYYLSASLIISLSGILEEAVQKGVALHFVLDFELGSKRWYTFYLWNTNLVRYSQSYGLSFNALTRNYRLTYGGLHQSFDNLQDALAVLGKVGRPRVIGHYHLKEGKRYIARLRMRLDKTRLPKPFQINAIGSSDWNLDSNWFSWEVVK